MNNKNESDDLASIITLRKITRRHLDAVLNLQVKPQQENLIATNAKAIAQAHFYRDLWYRAIYLGDVPIGFVLIVDSTIKYKHVTQKTPIYIYGD